MSRSWLLLSILLLSGCLRETSPDIEAPPPSISSTDFDRLPQILSGISFDDVQFFEGLPNQFWEPQLRETERRKKSTVEFHGYPFYDESLVFQTPHGTELKSLISSQLSFQKYRPDKQCSGFHADFCVEWKSSQDVTHALVSLECGEVEFFSPHGELRCDFTQSVALKLRELFSHYSVNRPKPEVGGDSR